MIKLIFRIVILLLFFLRAECSFGQFASVPLSLYQQFNGPFDYTIIGKSHNPFDNWAFPPQPCGMLTSTSASLSLSPNQNIVGAYLIWSGIGDGSGTNLNLNGNIFTPDNIHLANVNPPTWAPCYYFSAIKDITNYVQNFGNGIYQVTNFDLNPIIGLYCSSQIYYSGWNIVVVYSNPTLPNKQLNIYDGFKLAYLSVVNNVPYTIPISNLNVTSTVGAKMTYIAYNGSTNAYSGESVKINNNILSNAQNPPNNPFNSSNSFTGSNSNWNMDVDTYSINNYINVGDNSALITLNSNAIRLISTIITSIKSELPDATISLDNITGQDICQNHDLTLDYTVYNVNSNDTLLAGTPISVYANNNVLLSTVTLPSNILIGDSLSLSTLVNIPASISSPFSLSMVVNQNATQLGVYPESNFTNNTSNDSTISLTEIVYPFFGNVGPFCQGTSYTLPNTSLNNILGTWSPAFNNQATTTYTFTPNDTTCNQVIQVTVTIVPNSSPSFNIASNVCVNGNLVFPVSTQNGAFGTWAPAFNNQATTTYTWTPTAPTPAVGCPVPAQYTVNIIPQTQPVFSLIDSLCQGSSYAFPAQSNNGISGAWSPAFNSQATTTYTFTPTTYNVISGCPTSATHTVFVAPNFTPSFGLPSALCIGDAYTLPSVSNEGLSGTWSQLFNNQQTTNYTFTPISTGLTSISQAVVCPVSGTYSIGINTPVTPTFTLPDSICEGATVTLPLVSNNGVNGTWSPAFDNQNTTTYTFTPSAGLCPVTAQQTIVVSTLYDPTFSLPNTICQNEALTLPLISDNGISGTWSPAFDNQNSATYTFTPDASNIATCLVSAQHSVVIVPPTTPNFSFVTSLCAGSAFTLPTVSDNGIAGTWSVPFNDQVTTNYTFTPDTTSVLSSCSPSVTESIAIIPTLTPSFNFADSLCEDAVFNFPDISLEGINGIWTPTFNNQVTQNYTFTPSSLGITNTNIGLRCPQVVNQVVTILANPVADFTPQYSVLPLFMPSTILDNNSSNAYTYFWNFGDGTSNDSIFSPEHTFPEEAGSYLVSLQVSNQLGCMDTTSQVIVVEHDPVVFIPNAFTPDGDGLNNEFTAVFPENMKLASYEMYIYDRWGELVFYSQDPKQGWDASLAGFDAPDGVYSYLVKYKELGYVNKFQVTGSVVVIR